MLFLLLSLVSTPAFASIEKIENSYCAKVGLAAIYGAEKSYHSEYDSYSDSFGAIGYEPEKGQCETWQGSVRVFNGGKAFLATYTKPSTGETWNINEKKELRQEHEGREAAE